MKPARFAFVVLLVAAPALSAGGDPAAADVLFRDGRALMKKGDFTAACPKLAESQRLDPAPGTAINLGDCVEKLGKLADALQAYRDALDLLPFGDRRIGPVKEQIAALEKRVPKLTIQLAPGAPVKTRVLRDDVELGAESLGVALPVNPGEHVVEVSAQGHESKSITIQLHEADTKSISVHPGPATRAAETTPARATAHRQPHSDAAESDGWHTAAVILGVVGIVGIAAGAATGLAARTAEQENSEHCNDTTRRCDQTGVDARARAETMAVISNIGWVVGGLGLGVGGYLFLAGHGTPSKSSAPLGGVRVGGVW